MEILPPRSYGKMGQKTCDGLHEWFRSEFKGTGTEKSRNSHLNSRIISFWIFEDHWFKSGDMGTTSQLCLNFWLTVGDFSGCYMDNFRLHILRLHYIFQFSENKSFFSILGTNNEFIYNKVFLNFPQNFEKIAGTFWENL